MKEIKYILFEDKNEVEQEIKVEYEFYPEEAQTWEYAGFPASYDIISLEVDGVELSDEQINEYQKHLKKTKQIINKQCFIDWIENEIRNNQ